MNTPLNEKKSPLKFILLVFVISVPFWLIGTVVDRFLPKALSINLPFAALVFVCPMAVGLYLSYRENGWVAVKQLLKRALDYARIKQKVWYLPIILLWPVVMIFSYAWMKIIGSALSALQFPNWVAPVSLVLFFIGGIGEELGWMGYLIDPLQARWGALGAGVILGLVRASWHIVPFIQAHNTPVWILWQCLGVIPGQIMAVWLYNNTGKSVFAIILLHAIYNVITLVFPNYGFIFNPFNFFVLTAAAAVIVVLLWGPSLRRFRYARLERK